MPVWKFKAGDFSSRIDEFAQSLGMRAKTIRSDGTIATSSRPGFWRCRQAKRETRRLRSAVTAELGHHIDWNDDGPVVHSEQGHFLEAVRAYAKWLDFRDVFPTFDTPPKDNYYEHPAMTVQEVRPLTYPQLVGHCCYSGYFLPTEFDRVVQVEPYTIANHWTFHHSVGSAPRLLAELTHLRELLSVDEEWPKADDPLHRVKGALIQLLKAAQLSRDHNLPIIFCG
jgi:hypothetical protein